MDEDLYQTIASFIPEIYGDLGNLNPTELLQHIETRLVTTDQMEFKRMRFELAKHLLSYYRSMQINDKGRFVDLYKKDIYNKHVSENFWVEQLF